jgi:hypothetical protein
MIPFSIALVVEWAFASDVFAPLVALSHSNQCPHGSTACHEWTRHHAPSLLQFICLLIWRVSSTLLLASSDHLDVCAVTSPLAYRTYYDEYRTRYYSRKSWSKSSNVGSQMLARTWHLLYPLRMSFTLRRVVECAIHSRWDYIDDHILLQLVNK